MYDPKAGSLWTALQLSNTVVAQVLWRLEFWLFFGLHLLVYSLHRLGYLQSERDHMDGENVKIVTLVTTFFEVFYANQCYWRHNRLWSLLRSMFGAVYDFTFNARLFMRSSGQPYDRLACRWVVVSSLLFLYEVRRSGGKVGDPEWKKLEALGLLKRDEVDFLSGMAGPQRLLVMLHAAGDVSRIGLLEAKAPATATREVSTNLLRYRALQEEVRDLSGFPVPFEYVHLLSLMVTINLAFWAYSMGCTESIFSPLLYFFTLLIFLGLMEVASQLADPFGEDEAELYLPVWATEFLHNMAALLDYHHDGARENYRDDLAEENRSKIKLHFDLREVESLFASGGSTTSKSGLWGR